MFTEDEVLLLRNVGFKQVVSGYVDGVVSAVGFFLNSPTFRSDLYSACFLPILLYV